MRSLTFNTLAVLLAAVSAGRALNENDVVIEHRELASEPVISSDPCWTVRCPGDLPTCVVLDDGTAQCVKDPCADVTCKDGEVCYEQDVQCITAPCLPVPTCIQDPCVELVCNAASTCEIDGEGNAYCLPLPGNPGNPIDDLCAAVTCPVDAPICIVLKDGTTDCITDPCEDLICNAASTCEIDGEGNAYCLPLPGNPGNPIDNVTCAAVTCPIDAPICIILEDGTADCIKDPCVDLICNAASTCEIDGDGNAYCLPLPGNPGNPIDNVTCAAVTCPMDAPICIILKDGTADCVKDSCFDLICNAASTCEIDGEGNAY
ncbi:hypothetical protein MHU86_6773 [Fragilaria crotonensis]|nr:hypothetical protein MHU86_6773 [Fragilaria crotonensis]